MLDDENPPADEAGGRVNARCLYAEGDMHLYADKKTSVALLMGRQFAC
jgi:hypothetical protein